MKQQLLTAFLFCSLIACNTASTTSDTKDTSAVASTSAMSENVTYAYPVAYSDFTIGETKYAQTVLELWKDYDNNTFYDHKDAFADSVSMDLAGGMSLVNLPRDSVIGQIKQYRNTFTNAVSSVEAITTLKPKGKDEIWVCVWGKEVDTHSNNKVDSVYLNENWMFNKDGKIVYMAQYQAKPAPKK